MSDMDVISGTPLSVLEPKRPTSAWDEKENTSIIVAAVNHAI